MCLLMTVGSGFGITPDAHSRGTTGLVGVVGEVGCWQKTHTFFNFVWSLEQLGPGTLRKTYKFYIVIIPVKHIFM